MARFPRPDMVSDGEIQSGVISQSQNVTSRVSGRPYGSTKNQKGEENAIYGMESVGWESPLHGELMGNIPGPQGIKIRKPQKPIR